MIDDTQEIKTTPSRERAPASVPTSTPAPKRSSWYLLTGLILGVTLGLIYGWLINPILYESRTPVTLGETEKDIYRGIIAQVYAVTGDLERAAFRLTVLEDSDPAMALGAQAQRALAEGLVSDARALALLATALQDSQIPPDSINEPPVLPPTPTEPPPSIPTHTLPVPTNTP